GTLFLDEIGNLSISMQSKILTALQNREVTPIGTNQPTPIDIRLLSATNKDPIELISNNLFREDLYYRINTVQIKVPPLHDRDQDTLLLTEHFLNIYTRKYDRAGLKISNRAITKLVEYNWPGNIRELQHAIESAVIFSESGIIQPDDLLMRQKVQEPSRGESLLLSDVEKATIARAIDKYKGNYTTAATELGISRTTLYLKIKKYDL
nr:sigma 54-interacting transcriptional regulator [Bacteroidota bacterium]